MSAAWKSLTSRGFVNPRLSVCHPLGRFNACVYILLVVDSEFAAGGVLEVYSVPLAHKNSHVGRQLKAWHHRRGNVTNCGGCTS